MRKKTQQPKPDKVTRSIDYIFRMLRDGRMDEEEANLILELIFSGEMEDEDLDIISLIYRLRPKDLDSEIKKGSSLDSHGNISITIELGLG